jgi:prephenate dehydrogenase
MLVNFETHLRSDYNIARRICGQGAHPLFGPSQHIAAGIPRIVCDFHKQSWSWTSSADGIQGSPGI